jgi:integrase
MRYGEIASLRVGAFNPETGTLSVVTSKSGHSRHIVLTDEGRAFFADATAGKPTDALVFNRTDGGAWGKSHQHRPIQDACQAARIEPAISFHILRHTYASRLAMSGTPMPVIAAQLGHAGTRMTERHYAHLGPSYVAETVRALFAATGFSRRSNVTPMRTSTAA